MNIRIDTLAYTNRLRNIAVEQKVLFGFFMLFFVLCTHSFVHLAVFIWMSLWIVGYARIPYQIYARLLGAMAVFLLLTLPPMALEVTSGPIAEKGWLLFSLGVWKVYVSAEGIKAAGVLWLRSLASVTCLYFILLTTPFAELLGVMRRVGIPGLVTELLLIMYRFVFVFVETIGQIRIAQQARSVHTGFKNRMRDAGVLVTRLFAHVMHRYQQLSIGLAARGFEGDIRTAAIIRFPVSVRYMIEAVIGVSLLCVLEWWMAR
jgi:cobalt/nickel transport system permease protein